MNTNTQITVECTESACASFETGHEMFNSFDATESVIHELAPIVGWNYTLTVQRSAGSKEWSVDVDTERGGPEFTPDQAVMLAADLLRASTMCRALNSAPDLATVDRILAFASASGVTVESLRGQEVLDHLSA